MSAAILKSGYPIAGAEQVLGQAVALSDARAAFTNLVNQAAELGERVVITKFGKPAAGLVPVHDLIRLAKADEVERQQMEVDLEPGGELVDFGDNDEVSPRKSGENGGASGSYQTVAALVEELLTIPAVREYINRVPGEDQSEDEVGPHVMRGAPSQDENGETAR